MYEDFIRKRITELRLQKNISEYRMSMDLGHSKSYIQSISSGRALPSMSEFLFICDYFGITPIEFFQTDNKDLLLLKELYNKANRLDEDDLNILIKLTERFNKK